MAHRCKLHEKKLEESVKYKYKITRCWEKKIYKIHNVTEYFRA